MEPIVNLILYFIIYIILFAFAVYVKRKVNNLATKEDIREISYEKIKGENLATKEDIKEITKNIESVKSEFQKYIDEHKIKFEKLHESRFDYITELYKKLLEIYKEVNYYCEMMPYTDRKEFRELAFKSYKIIYDLYIDYQKNSLLSTDKIDTLMEDMYNKYKAAIKEISKGANVKIRLSEGRYFNSEIVNNAYKQIDEGMKIFESEIKVILEEIKNEFKVLL